MGNTRLRRLLTLCGAAAIASGSLLALAAPAAQAAPAPKASDTWTFQTTGQFAFTVLGTLSPPANFTGQLSAGTESGGTITFTTGNIHFDDVSTTLSGIPAVVHLSASTNWTSTVDQTSGGLVTLTGSLLASIDLESQSQFGCPLGPIPLHLSSANPNGVGFHAGSANDTATVTDTKFGVPTFTSSPPSTCTLGALITTALGLPITAGQTAPARYVNSALKIFEPGVVVPTTTTTTLPPAGPIHAPTTVQAGSQLTITGGGWLPGSTVTIILNSTPVVLGTATVSAQGAFTAVVTIPADTPAGAHTIVLTGTNVAGVPRQVSQAITVTAAASSSELPRTGGSTLPYTIAGVTLLLAGLALVLSQRRRPARV